MYSPLLESLSPGRPSLHKHARVFFLLLSILPESPEQALWLHPALTWSPAFGSARPHLPLSVSTAGNGDPKSSLPPGLPAFGLARLVTPKCDPNHVASPPKVLEWLIVNLGGIQRTPHGTTGEW